MYKILGGDGKEYGPVSADILRQWVSEGRANAQTQVQPEGAPGWVSLGAVPEFAGLWNAPAPFAAGPVRSAAPAQNPLAIIGFILSIVSLTFGLCCCYGLPFSIPGIVCSGIALAQIRKQPGRYSGRGLAMAGVIVGIVSLLVAALLLVLGVALSWDDIRKELNKP
jgi:hypothetical protein